MGKSEEFCVSGEQGWESRPALSSHCSSRAPWRRLPPKLLEHRVALAARARKSILDRELEVEGGRWNPRTGGALPQAGWVFLSSSTLLASS